MNEAVVCVCTVFFEDPFWVGVFERMYCGRLETARVVFGAEPTEPEIQDFLINRWSTLRYTVPVELEGALVRSAVNPKRAVRLARRQMDVGSIGTKSQQALQEQREELAESRKQYARTRRQEMDQRRFLERQEKKKLKKRGH